MPTKERIRRKKELEAANEALNQELDKILPTEKYPKNRLFEIKKRAYLDLYATNFIKFDVGGHPSANSNVGKGGNEQRKDDKRDRAARLKIKYPDDWCSRGGAGRIFRKEAKLYEKEIAEGKVPISSRRLTPRKKKGDVTVRMRAVKAEKPAITAEKLTEGTIRRYFNDFP
jgi:hypothetical protein